MKIKEMKFSITFKPTKEFVEWMMSLPSADMPMNSINDYNRNKWK